MDADQLYNSLARKYPGLAYEQITMTQKALRSLVRLAWMEGWKAKGGEAPSSEIMDILQGIMKEKR